MNLRGTTNTEQLPRRLQSLKHGDATHDFWCDKALPFVESRRACHSRACYRLHHHATFSIGAVDAGSSVFTGANDSPTTLLPGALIFIPAERAHSCNPTADAAWSYQMLHLDLSWLQTMRQEDVGAASIAPEPVRIVSDPSSYTRFCQLNTLLFSKASSHDKEAALIEFIGDMDAQQGLHIEAKRGPAGLAAQIQPALAYLRAVPADSIRLIELARLTGLSRYQLIRAFRAVTGLTPHAWQLNERINLARLRIREGDDFADLAYGLGFSDQAHFQRVFKAYAGVTPGSFRDIAA